MIRLTIAEIPKYWELIKHAYVSACEIPECYVQKECNDLLYKLLSEQSGVIFIVDQNKIFAACIYSYNTNMLTNQTTVHIDALYAYHKCDDTKWVDAVTEFVKLHSNEHYDFITFNTNNPRVLEIANSMNVVKTHEQYKVNLH